MYSFTQAKTTKANRLVLYHACFAVPNATIASLCGVLTLFCNHKVSSCKLFGTLPYLFCSNELNCNRFLFFALLDVKVTILSAFTAHKCTFLHQHKQQLPTSCYCTMSVFCRTNCNNCKPMWWCTEIVLRQLHFFAIYLCFAGINEPNCMFLFFVLIDFQSDYVSCDHILSACAAHKLNAQLYRQTANATTANGLVMYHAATIRVLQCQMQKM